MFKRTARGFTLIELLVVIAIIGILSSVVLASLNDARTKSRDAKRVADVKQLQLALELYFDSNGGYPTTAEGLDALVTAGSIAAIPTPGAGVDNATYLYVSSSVTDYCLATDLEAGTSHAAAVGSCNATGITNQALRVSP